jgi:serine protease AprX
MKNSLRLTLSLLVTTLGAFAGSVSPDLRALNPSTSVRVLIQFNSPPSADTEKAVKGGGATLNTKFKHFLKLGVYTMKAGQVNGIAHNPAVKYISLDRTVQKHLDLTAATVGANVAFQSGLTGAGVGVAVLDSGIDARNADLGKRVVYSEDFVGTGTKDFYGHGTHVAGIIGGNGANSGGQYRGIAPGVNLINLRVLDERGAGAESAVIAAIDRAIELKATYNIRVLNLSVGRPIYEPYYADPLCQAVSQAWQAGIVVVVAAGNDIGTGQRSVDYYRGSNENRRHPGPRRRSDRELQLQGSDRRRSHRKAGSGGAG